MGLMQLREVGTGRLPRRSDWAFIAVLAVIGGTYVLLIVALLAADLEFVARDGRAMKLFTPEILYSIRLTLISCTISTILSLWVGVPLGYLLSRYKFRGKALVDVVLDIPIVLPPLVIGLSLLILFQSPPGKAIEWVTANHMGFVVTYIAIPTLVAVSAYLLPANSLRSSTTRTRWLLQLVIAAIAALFAILILHVSGLADWLVAKGNRYFNTEITYAIPAVILAQFTVACAFAARTMRVTFDGISPRNEQVALTLGCTRSQAFWWVVLPEAGRGMLTAGTLAWARALGEFGPILIFAGVTRMHTEVLPTTVFLELSVGSLSAAVWVSLLMVATAITVLMIVRLWGVDSKLR